jgi:uncharacterized protein YpiB (UPF0302 family)
MINISNYIEFLNVIDNQATIDMTEVAYIKELKECQESQNRSCCAQKSVISKNCNEKLYSIIDEAITNDPDLRSKIKQAFDGAEISFNLQGKQLTL